MRCVYRRRTSAFALLLAVLLLFSSCGLHPADTEGVTLTDALGREVTVPEHPVRVAALLGSFADVWTLAGGTVVAATTDAYREYGLPTEGAVDLGGAHSPGLEALISADPDLVLASASTASHVALCDTLEAMGIPVLYFEVDHFDDYLAMLKTCTALTGREDLYDLYGTRLKAEIDAIRVAAHAIPDEEKKILLLRASSGAVKAKGSDGTVLGEMLASVGCTNIADGDGTLLEQLSVEEVIRREPYRIFIVTMGSDTETAIASVERMLAQDPAWRSLSAVREGRVHYMEKALYNSKPNDRWGEAYEKLYEILESP